MCVSSQFLFICKICDFKNESPAVLCCVARRIYWVCVQGMPAIYTMSGVNNAGFLLVMKHVLSPK